MPITHSETPRGLISLISFVGVTRRFQTGRARVVGPAEGLRAVLAASAMVMPLFWGECPFGRRALNATKGR